MAETILVIDEDKDFRALVVEALGWGDYRVLSAESVAEGILKARKEQPDLIVLSFFTDESNGIEVCEKWVGVCEQLKGEKATAAIPIIAIDQGDTESYDIAFLDKGADDFIIHRSSDEVDPYIWLARCRVQLRRLVRKGVAVPRSLKVGDDMTLIRSAKLVCIRGREFPNLTPKEFDLLYFLAQRSPQHFDAETLHREVWKTAPRLVEGFRKPTAKMDGGDVMKLDLNKVEVCIFHIRKKLGFGTDQGLINIPGRGYAVKPLPPESAAPSEAASDKAS